MKKFFKDNSANFYFVFRILIGIGFLLHGIMKIGGITSGKTALFSLVFLAAVIEVIGGAFIILGLATRIVASIAALEMLYVYIFVHTFGKNFVLSPLANKGETAMLYFASFLVLIAFGAGKWSLDKEE